LGSPHPTRRKIERCTEAGVGIHGSLNVPQQRASDRLRHELGDLFARLPRETEAPPSSFHLSVSELQVEPPDLSLPVTGRASHVDTVRDAMAQLESLLTKEEARRVLRISRATFARVIARGEMPVVRAGARAVRISPGALREFIERRTESRAARR
jgi:excisionase family DNA binding protein